jgi:Bacillus phage endonuclease
MKVCSICKVAKDKKKFWKSKQHADGLRVSCIECLKKKNSESYKKNSEKLIAYQKKYYAENRDKVLKYHEEYRADNPDKIKASQRRTYYSRTEEDIQRENEIARNYRRTSEKYKEWWRKYAAKKDSKWKARWILNNAIRDGKIVRPNICQICAQIRKLDGHHADYNKPLQVLWVCRKCHTAIHYKRDA